MPIQSYPNQKMVYINREMPKQSKENKRSYMVAYNDNIATAMQYLKKASSIKLYFYLLGNVDNYHFALSTQDVANKCGISVVSAKDAVNDLIEKGFLVLREKKTYDFYELPQADIGLEPEEEVKKKFRRKDGEVQELSYSELVALCGEAKAQELWRTTK